MTSVVAVITDIVGSRMLDDRAGAQRAVHAAFAFAEPLVPTLRGLWSTAGDEFQCLYASIDDACAATALVRVALDRDVDVRFGIGEGNSRDIENPAAGAVIVDGSAWWNARAAIEEAEHRGARNGTARSWVVSGGVRDRDVNAALLVRDHTITLMKPRERRIAAALMAGEIQSTIAEAEGITQSAVSQSARRSGAHALVQANQLWLAEETA